MATEPIDDIVAWSQNLAPWRLDCLRRLAASNDFTDADFAELFAMIQQRVGWASAHIFDRKNVCPSEQDAAVTQR